MSEDMTLDEFSGQDTETEDEQPFSSKPKKSRIYRCKNSIIPTDWKIKPANEFMEITRGASPRPRSDDSLFGGEIPWIKIGDADLDKSHQITEVESFVTEKGKKKSRFVEEGTLLVSNSGATCGFAVFAGVDGCVHDGWLILRDYDEIVPGFLYHYINWNYEYLQSLSLGSAQTNLRTSLFGRLDIAKPPTSEQRKIASVLHSVDQAIHKTGEIIEQTERVQKGIMQDLFRNGIGNPGTKRLRRIGQVPEHWDVVKLGEVCEKVTDGTHKSPPTIENGYPYITSQNVRNWGFDLSNLKYISEEDHNRITSRCNPERGDVLYVKDGANTGNVNVNTLDFEFSLLSSVALIKPKRSEIKPWFLKYLFSWPKFRELVISQMSGTGIRRLTISKLEKTDILVPPIDEQVRIIDILNKYYSYRENQSKTRDRLQRLKQGLMQDLLSGKVRTTDTNIEVLPEVEQYG